MIAKRFRRKIYIFIIFFVFRSLGLRDPAAPSGAAAVRKTRFFFFIFSFSRYFHFQNTWFYRHPRAAADRRTISRRKKPGGSLKPGGRKMKRINPKCFLPNPKESLKPSDLRIEKNEKLFIF